MKKSLLVTLFLAASFSGAAAKGGQQTWILVCPKSMPKGECNLTTAAQWFHLPSPQASANTADVKAAKAKVAGALDGGFYVSVEQFPAGVSMGERGRVFRACDSDGAAAPADAQQAEWARRGECLQ